MLFISSICRQFVRSEGSGKKTLCTTSVSSIKLYFNLKSARSCFSVEKKSNEQKMILAASCIFLIFALFDFGQSYNPNIIPNFNHSKSIYRHFLRFNMRGYGRTQTLDIVMMRKVFYHCVNPKKTWNFLLFLYLSIYFTRFYFQLHRNL